MQNILLIINPAAGVTGKKSRVFRVADWFRNQKFGVTVLSTTKKGDAEEYVKNYSSKADVVVCCGGDGTLNEVINGIMQLEEKKPIGYLPAGTTNDMARTLDIPSNIQKAAKIIVNGVPIQQDIGTFNNTQYFAYIASFGAFTKVSYATPQWLKNRFGHLAYVVSGLKSVNEIQPYTIKVRYNDREESGSFIFGSVSNSISIGGVLHLKPTDISLNDGKFEVLLIHNPKNVIEFQNIVHDLHHHHFNNENIEFFSTDDIVLSFETPTDWTIDGEYAGKPQTVEITNLHNAIQLIRRE